MEKVTSKFLVKLGSDTCFLFVAVQKKKSTGEIRRDEDKDDYYNKTNSKGGRNVCGNFFQDWITASDLYSKSLQKWHGEAEIR